MKVTVFCGASNGNRPIYQEKAIELGQWIARQGHQLVYGGGKVGLMGVIADTVLANGGEVIGVMPTFLIEREISHPNITVLHEVDDMSQRKDDIIDNGDVFIALPGGPGTLEEISQVISWVRVTRQDAPCIVMNVAGYYDALESLLDTMVNEGFLTVEDRAKTLFSADMAEIEGFVEEYARRQLSWRCDTRKEDKADACIKNDNGRQL